MYLNPPGIGLRNSKFYLYLLVIITSGLLAVSCSEEGGLFTNPSSSDTGITFTNLLTPTEDLSILDYLYFYNGGGVAIGDINGDNLPDIYFSANQKKNELYLNKGGLKFENITESAGVAGESTWNTGSVMADVNGDGLLDIYVCAVVGLNGFRGKNELFINNGDSTFTESAKEFGLDFDTYSSTATFFDYDLDGDLDMYLLNHAVHTQESFGEIDLRYKRNYETGDRLLRNDNNKFVDVSEEAGIYGGINGYGLGVSISDFNKDGFPDIYVGNDFHEDDYFYLNNQDGTFSDQLRSYFGHTTRFSMGNDVADINHDGWPDLISLDMLSNDENVLKASEGDEQIQIQKLRTERYGYHYQYARNMLFINQANAGFAETAILSGIEATDWSWSALFGDYNQDGEQDLFISNGIPKRPNDLDFIRFVSNEQIQNKISNTKLVDEKALDMMPTGSVANYIFQGKGDLQFEDMSSDWIVQDTLVSSATAIADLDLDGDLDIVTNNINSPATLYINKGSETGSFLKLKFKYKAKNKFGIGTKVYAYSKGKFQYRELYNIRGFQSSSEPIVHFGFNNVKSIDSLKIIWPDNTIQVETKIKVNQTLTIKPLNNFIVDSSKLDIYKETLFENDTTKLGIDFKHVEDRYTDFTRQTLLPYSYADRGPALAIGDFNGDGRDDIYFGSSKFNRPSIYMQEERGFTKKLNDTFFSENTLEEVTADVADLDGDGSKDLIIGTGGGDFFGTTDPLLNRIYFNKGDTWKTEKIEDLYGNASVIKSTDFDNDGDMDVFIGNSMITGDFGKIPESYILINNSGNLEVSEQFTFKANGFITDALFNDFNNDGNIDLIIVGEWMAPTVYINKGDSLEAQQLSGDALLGLWQAIIEFDIDNDGDLDILLGNWGQNSKFNASEKSPIKMYYADFDNSGQTETVIAKEKNGKYYTFANLDELGGQMVSLKKKFTSHKAFAGKSVEEIFDGSSFKKAKIFKLNNLASGYLKNEDGNYKFVPFNNWMQFSPITSFIKFDFNNDNKDEILAAGNYFGVTPYHGRYDSFLGALIFSDAKIERGSDVGLDFFNKSARHLNIINFKDKPYLMATFNNDSVQVYNLKKYKVR